MKKILLLGGAGFIGLEIARVLAQRGDASITIADNFRRNGGRLDASVADLRDRMGVRICEGDFTDPSAFAMLGDGFDDVYMLASVVGVDYVNSMPHEIIRINSALILNCLEWIRKVGCQRTLFTSTSECYAGTIESFGYAVPTPESVPLTIGDIGHPRFTYAVTKMLGESGFINYGRQCGFNSVVVRYHNVYGPRMGFKHVIPHLAQRFMAHETPFKVFGHDQTRSFNFIDDAVAGTIAAAERGQPGGIYHIGDTDEISIETLVKFVGDLFGYTGPYENAPTYPGSVSRRCPDISRAVSELGYQPRTGWQTGVGKTIAWYRDYLANSPELSESFYDNVAASRAVAGKGSEI